MEIMQELQKWLDFNEGIPKHYRLAQGKLELSDFCEVLKTLKQRKICLEIGIFFGGTFYCWKLLFEKVIGLDISREYSDYVSWNLERYGCDKSTSHFIVGNSQSGLTIENVKKYLNGQSVDFLFIDGAHGYEALIADFKNYYDLVRPGGIIGIHDVGERNKPHGYTPPGLTPTFENVWRGILDIERDKEKYGISEMQFIHKDHGGIGWCTKK